MCTAGSKQWEEDVRLTTRSGEVVGTCKELADWQEEFMQEMTIKSPPSPVTMDTQEEVVDRTLVRGEEIVPPLSKERIIHHQHSKSDESNQGFHNVSQSHHKQTRSDEILNHSGPPPVPTNSPAQSDTGQKKRNNSKTSLGSVGRSNSKSLENLPQATYALDNSVTDNKIHKCASQDSMQSPRINGNTMAGQSDSQDESMSSINTNNSLSGVSIMENLVREFGLQPHSLTANSSALLAGEQVQRLQTDERGPPPSYPGSGKAMNNLNRTQEGDTSANNNAGENQARPTTPNSGSLLSKSRSYESMQDSVTR